jgi:hypothetical protein
VEILIGAMGVLVTLMVAAGMIYMTPRNLDGSVRPEDGVVATSADHEAAA